MMGIWRLSISAAAVAGLSAVLAYGGAAQAPSGAKIKTGPVAIDPSIKIKLPPGVLLIGPRKSITALTATELANLRKGYAQMIAWNSAPHGSANFKRSLKYWANMHAYFGTGCAGTGGLSQPGMSGLSAQSKSNADENATWCTCQHGTNQFLTWHRMYLWYFEKVLQAASGSPSLRLPYWDYETDGHIPAAFRTATYVNSSGVTVANPLFVANRKSTLNSGTGTLSAAVVSTSGINSQTSYLPYNSAIEGTPHGAVHCATGVANCPTGYMGAVPAAGNDPIFYSHHANIDRLYECWLKVNPAGRLPTGAILNANFSFIDGAGALVSRKVGDMLTTSQLSYSYTAGGGCPLVISASSAVLSAAALRVVPLVGSTPLERGTTAVPVKIPADVRAQVRRPEAGGPQAAPRQATLVIDDLTFAEAPGVMFEVALRDASGKSVTVGVINFFNRTAPDHGQHDGDADDHRFDATAALQALGSDSAQLELRPTSGVTAPNTPEAEEQVSPNARVRFAAARIELR
jgi:hypothetical protein